MATRKDHQTNHKKSQVHVESSQTASLYDIPLTTLRTNQRSSILQSPNISEMKKSSIKYNGFEYQLIPVEIEKSAELGLVVGQVEGEQWVFIDEILSNGMIDMHGTLKEGDYLLQAGVYSLTGIDISIALVLVERAYNEGRNTVSFVAARQQKPDRQKVVITTIMNRKEAENKPDDQELTVQTSMENKNDKQE